MTPPQILTGIGNALGEVGRDVREHPIGALICVLMVWSVAFGFTYHPVVGVLAVLFWVLLIADGLNKR